MGNYLFRAEFARYVRSHEKKYSLKHRARTTSGEIAREHNFQLASLSETGMCVMRARARPPGVSFPIQSVPAIRRNVSHRQYRKQGIQNRTATLLPAFTQSLRSS